MTVELGGAVISVHALMTVGMTALLVAGLWVLLHRTSFGIGMRAVAQDVQAAKLMGLKVNRLLAMSWVLGALLAGAAGLLLGPMWFADVNMGDPVALKAFAATIIGGFGSLPGAVIGGIFVGLSEVLGASYISSAEGCRSFDHRSWSSAFSQLVDRSRWFFPNITFGSSTSP
jgi:branched-chain amino acid transport system permease protein